METDDSVRSKPRKSEECFSRECDAWATEGLIKEATFFCPKCEERLCNSCESWHNKLKATRSHKVLPVTEAPQHMLTDNSITAESFRIACDCGGESDLLYFCKNHETVVCSSCRSIKHWKCKTSTVEYLSRKQNISERFDEITDKTNELIKKGLQIQTNIAVVHTDLDESEKFFKQEMKRFRINLDRWLDSLEENSVEELEYCSRQTSDTLKIHGRTVAKILQCLRETKFLLDVMHKSHNKTQMLIVKCKLQNLLKICDHDLQGIEDKVSDSKFLFTPNKDLSKLHQRLDSLGQVDVRGPLGDDIIRNVFLSVRPEKINTVKVKQPDKIRCHLTVVVFTNNGDILAANSRNNRVLLLDAKTMKIQSTCAYPKPFFQLHLATFDDQTCLSLIHGQMEMQFIKVKPQLRISERKMLDKVCHAIAVIKEGIFLLCSSDGPESPLHVIVMDANGIISKTIQSVEMETRLESSAYYNMAVSLDGLRLFFAQNMPSVQSRVICMTVSGKHVYTSDDSDMREVRGIVADAENNILVCCETSNNVLLMRSDGTKQKALLTSEDGINRPNTIGFRFSDGMLVVGDNGETGIGDVLSMFKIK